MRSRCALGISAVVVGLLFIGIRPALAQLSATATISDVPDGPNFDYRILLHNTGSSDIGTFWFAWTPPGQPFEYDFLPSNPSATGGPDGWFVPSSLGFPGYSIENYNYLGSPISPGQTGTFTFTSSDSPTVLQGTSILNFPILTSFIYAGAPLDGPTAQVNPVFVPEPSLLLPGVVTLMGYVATARRRHPDRKRLG